MFPFLAFYNFTPAPPAPMEAPKLKASEPQALAPPMITNETEQRGNYGKDIKPTATQTAVQPQKQPQPPTPQEAEARYSPFPEYHSTSKQRFCGKDHVVPIVAVIAVALTVLGVTLALILRRN